MPNVGKEEDGVLTAVPGALGATWCADCGGFIDGTFFAA